MNRREASIIALALAALLAALAFDLRGPAPKPATAPSAEFSAARAIGVLRDLVQEGRPHPVGTDANRLVRDRIVQRFQSLGYETAVDRSFVCNATPSCATVENIVAGTSGDPGPYVLLVSHYDSVGAGPGASDAGVPVAAILETARALRGTRGVAYLITDGEEAGLLGAEAFVKTAMKERVGVVVNAENRGTSGPAFLFETSRGNAGLMRAIRAIERPYASSLFYTIYDLLPNDTDVSVFKRADMTAMNFGAIGNVEYYHTPLDDLAHVNMRTLQHHGDNVLSAARALLLGFERSTSNAVYFNLPLLGVISWPQSWTAVIIAVIAIVLVVMSREESWRGISMGAAMTLLTMAVAVAGGFFLTWLAHLRSGGATRLAYPQAVTAAMWLVGIAAALLCFALPFRRDLRSMHAGVAVAWLLIAIALAFTLPGTVFLALVPVALMAVSLRFPPLVCALVASLAAGVVLFPLTLFLYPALGKTSLPVIAVLVALICTTVAVLIDRRVLLRAGLFAAAMAPLLALLTIALPVYTAEQRRRDPIEHELVTPTVEATATRAGDIATIRVKSGRNADRLTLKFEGDATVIRVNGFAPAPPNRRRAWRGNVVVYAREAVVEVRAAPGTAVEVSDVTYGLPRSESERAQQRDRTLGITSHRGDVTLSRTRIRL